MLVKPFGPEIYHSKLPKDINDILYAACIKNKDIPSKATNASLVGLITKEFDILSDIQLSVLPTLTNLVLDYLNTTSTINKALLPIAKRDVVCRSSWCNIQGVMEFNPLHNHLNYSVVCVCFPKIEISTKQKFLTNQYVEPGTLAFQYGENLNIFGDTSYQVKPETGDVYIFPASLKHYTYPIYGEDDVRISTSSNFVFSEYFNQKLSR